MMRSRELGPKDRKVRRDNGDPYLLTSDFRKKGPRRQVDVGESESERLIAEGLKCGESGLEF